MELTQATVGDLLDRIGPEDGCLHPPGDTDPQELTELLGDRYGAPRTLVLDGVADPAAGESGCSDLLLPFGDRAVTLRVWAYGGQWVGAGTARDGEGVVRPVPAVARREVPEPPAAGPGEGVDWVERLERITGWTRTGRRPEADWAQTAARLGTPLPGDYRRMVETFGAAAFDAYLDLYQEPWTHLSEDGLLVWAGTEHEDQYCWRTDGDDPDRWPVVVRSFDDEDVLFACGSAEFVCRILTDPRHRFTMARWFDTHWFMPYRARV